MRKEGLGKTSTTGLSGQNKIYKKTNSIGSSALLKLGEGKPLAESEKKEDFMKLIKKATSVKMVQNQS